VGEKSFSEKGWAGHAFNRNTRWPKPKVTSGWQMKKTDNQGVNAEVGGGFESKKMSPNISGGFKEIVKRLNGVDSLCT